MPSQRDPNKRSVSTWVPRKLYAELKRAAAAEGVPMSTFVERLYREAVEKWEKSRKK